MLNADQYKELSIKEFTKAAKIYDNDYSGIYQTCKKNYPDILEEVKKEDFNNLLDVGCGTGPMIYLLSNDLPDKEYVGLDLTPAMIEAANTKQIQNAKFIVGDAENLPFEENTFNVVICSESFHHYPNPQDFFNSVYKVLKPNGRLILRDYMADGMIKWLVNHIELPLANLIGHGDVKVRSEDEYRKMIQKSSLQLEEIKKVSMVKVHIVARKTI